MNRVLIVTPGYYPAKTYGGPVVSIKNLTDTLGNEIEFYILTSNHELKQKDAIEGLPSGFSQNGKAWVCYISDEEMNTGDYKKILDEVKPDCIYINAIFHRLLSPPMIKLAKKRCIRCVIAPRGGLNENALNFSKCKKLLYLQYIKNILGRNVCFQSTSKEESEAIRKHFGRKKELVEVPNYPKCLDVNAEKYRRKKKKGEVRIIYFSRIHPIKNLKIALEAISRLSVVCYFDIYGPIEKSDYWKECEDLINELPPNVHTTYSGYLSSDKLGETIGAYDIFILPTSSENFGHAIAEALAERCNVLISNNTPWNDINQFEFGRALPLEQIDKYTDFISLIAGMSEEELQKTRDDIPRYLDLHFDYKAMKAEYMQLFGI